MSARDHYVAGERPDWRGATPGREPVPNTGHRLIDSPWIIGGMAIIATTIYVVNAMGWL